MLETTEAAEIYHVLTYGSADDNMLILPNLAAHHGEVRFYPTGMVTLIDYGTETGTYVQNNLSEAESGYVFGSSPLYDYNTVVFDHSNTNTFTIADLRRILLKRRNTDALFTGAEVRQYQRYIRELFEKRNTNTFTFTHNPRVTPNAQLSALASYDEFGF